MAQEQIRAVGYARVSTDEQAAEGLSLGDQERRVRAHAEAQGWTMTNVYTDAGVSGSVPFTERPAGAEAMADEVDRLVMVKLDRLGRSAPDLLDTIERFTSRGCAVVSVSEAIDTATPTGRLLRTVLAGVSEFERDRISERTAEAASAIARQGRYNGPRPCGYRFEGGLLQPVKHERRIVQRIFREFVAGRSRREITTDLNADRVPTVRRGLWRQSTVTSILKNPVYIGQVRCRGEVFDGAHDPILDQDLWDQAQALLSSQERQRGKGRGRRPRGQHLFVGGLLRCAECGEPMVPRTNAHTGPSAQDYLCNGRLSFGPDFCSTGTVHRAEIDTAVYRYFEQVGLDVEATREAIAQANDHKLAEVRALREEAEREAHRAEERLARVRGHYQEGKIEPDDWAEQRPQLTEERDGAQAEAERLRASEAELADVADLDAEAETLRHLARIRAAVAGEVQSAEGIEAVRAALSRLFERFTLHRGTPTRAHVELIGETWIEPVLIEKTTNLSPETRIGMGETKTEGAWATA